MQILKNGGYDYINENGEKKKKVITYYETLKINLKTLNRIREIRF